MKKMISIAILCSSDTDFEKCIKSVDNELAQELVVVNKPTPKVLSIIEENNYNYIRLDSKSLGGLREFAVQNCKTPYILFIDSDCILHPNSINDILLAFREPFDVIKPNFIFDCNSFGSKITSELRSLTSNNDILFVPIAFRCDISDKIGGYCYNHNLLWGEDRDFSIRVKKSTLRIKYLQSATIVHKKLSIAEDLKSAYRLGEGRYYQVKNNVLKKRNLLSDIVNVKDIVDSFDIAKKKSILVGLYHLFGWRIAYKFGYYIKTYKNGK